MASRVDPRPERFSQPGDLLPEPLDLLRPQKAQVTAFQPELLSQRRHKAHGPDPQLFLCRPFKGRVQHGGQPVEQDSLYMAVRPET